MSEAATTTLGRDRALGFFYGAISVSIFASFVLMSRVGMRTQLGSEDLLALRFGIGGLCMLPIFLRFGLRGVGALNALALALLGGLGFAALAYGGIARAPATHATVFLHGSLPLSTVLIAAVSSRRWPDRRRIAGVAIITAGIVAIGSDSVLHGDSGSFTGDVMLFFAAASWSAYALLAHALRIPALQAASIVAVISAILYLPLYAMHGAPGLLEANASDLVTQAAFQGVVIGAVSIFVYTRAAMLLGPTAASLLTPIVPALTTLLAIPILGEWPSQIVTIGVILTTIGMGIALRSTSKAAA